MRKKTALRMSAVLFICVLNSCHKSFQDKGLDIDNDGRGLSVAIIYPESNLNTISDQVTILTQAHDNLNQINPVEIRINGQPYNQAVLEDDFWQKNFSEILEKNTVCAKVTTTIGGVREKCANFYKTLSRLESAPQPFKSGSCVYDQNKLYCLGGEGNSGNLLIYNTALGLRESVDNMVEKVSGQNITRKFSAAAHLNGKIYVLGGLDQSDLPPLNFLAYHIAQKEWHVIAPTLNLRVGASAVSVGGKIYLIGGGSGYPGLGVDFHKSVEVYDPAQLPLPEWKKLEYELNYPRAAFAAVTDGRYILVAGGYNTDQKVLNSAEIFDTDNPQDGWKLLPPMNLPRFLAGGGIIQNRYFYVFGGINFNERLKAIERYDLIKNQWEITGVTDYLVTETAYAADGAQIYFAGGVNRHDEKISDVIRFKPYLD